MRAPAAAHLHNVRLADAAVTARQRPAAVEQRREGRSCGASVSRRTRERVQARASVCRHARACAGRRKRKNALASASVPVPSLNLTLQRTGAHAQHARQRCACSAAAMLRPAAARLITHRSMTGAAAAATAAARARAACGRGHRRSEAAPSRDAADKRWDSMARACGCRNRQRQLIAQAPWDNAATRTPRWRRSRCARCRVTTGYSKEHSRRGGAARMRRTGYASNKRKTVGAPLRPLRAAARPKNARVWAHAPAPRAAARSAAKD
jgi:hypothetical protein